MHGFQFNVGDLLKVGSSVGFISSPANPDKHYEHSLRVEFQFWDGQDNVYVVVAEDGIEMLLMEKDAELQEAAGEPAPMKGGEYIDIDTYNALKRLGMLDTSVRSYNRGTSDYSQHFIQPWSIWLDYKLDSFDADIVKRILRTKQGDSRRLDYEKIIHICEEKIRQIECE